MNDVIASNIRYVLISFGVGTVLCTAFAPSAFAHESADENAVVIHVHEDGFEPDTIHIAPGTEVIFENVGESTHWPATDNHPSHTLYDGTSLKEHCDLEHSTAFDSCGPIAPGESWSFVFEKTGVFGFHDHLWPHLEGTIMVGVDGQNGPPRSDGFLSRFIGFVRGIFVKVSRFLFGHDDDPVLRAGNTDSSFDDLKHRYRDLVIRQDPREAIHALREESARDAHVRALCHDVLHEIGHVAYQKYGSFSDAVGFQSDFCNSGYVHGLFEEYFTSTDDPLSGLAEQCTEYASHGGRAFDLWQCHHGIGHGFMYLTGGNLDESLALCEQGLAGAAISSCQNGVYMEVFNLEILAKENDFVDPQNPFATCRDRDTAKGDCYLYVPTYLSQTVGKDFPDIFEECNKAELGYEHACVHGIGSEAIKRNMNDPESVFALCRHAGSSAGIQSCVTGVVGMYMNQEGSYAAGQSLCEQAPRDFRATCTRAVLDREALFK